MTKQKRDILEAPADALPALLQQAVNDPRMYLDGFRARVRALDYQQRQRFLDHFGKALSHRLGAGQVEPRLWVLYDQAEDWARALLLVLSEAN